MVLVTNDKLSPGFERASQAGLYQDFRGSSHLTLRILSDAGGPAQTGLAYWMGYLFIGRGSFLVVTDFMEQAQTLIAIQIR